METMTGGIQPMYDLARNDNDFGGNWFWIIVLLLFGNNGWNRGGDRCIDDQFLMRDVFNTNTNVLTSTSQLQQDIAASTFAAKDCCCQTKQEILENRYQNALQHNGLQALMQQEFCNTRTMLGNEIRDLKDFIKDDKISALREQLFTATQAYNNQTLASNIVSQLQPVAKPAYIVSSPYATNYYPNTCPCANL